VAPADPGGTSAASNEYAVGAQAYRAGRQGSKITPIYEGTNQIERMVMTHRLLKRRPATRFRRSATILAGHAVTGQIPCGADLGGGVLAICPVIPDPFPSFPDVAADWIATIGHGRLVSP